jgi:hypothetical protein
LTTKKSCNLNYQLHVLPFCLTYEKKPDYDMLNEYVGLGAHQNKLRDDDCYFFSIELETALIRGNYLVAIGADPIWELNFSVTKSLFVFCFLQRPSVSLHSLLCLYL